MIHYCFKTLGKTELAKQTANYLHKDNPKVNHAIFSSILHYTLMVYYYYIHVGVY